MHTGYGGETPQVPSNVESEIRRVLNRAVLEAADNFIGLVGNPFDQGDLFNDQFGSNWFGSPYYQPPWYWQSQKRGEVIPVYLNELQLRYIRDRQRKLLSENPYAQCAVAAYQNYCVGEDGYTFSCVPAHHRETNGSHLRQTQRIVEVWNEENDMPAFCRDMVEAGITNGDIIARHFPQHDGIVWERRIEAEHVRSPTGGAYDARHSFGIQTPANDVGFTEGYWIVDDPLTNPNPAFVPADEVCFIKQNTPMSAKRGRPLFDGMCEVLLRGAVELLRATMATVTARAKIALIRKFNNVVKDAAAKLVQELTTQTVTDPGNQQQQSMDKFRYGTILNSSSTIEYEMPAQNFETNIHYQALQMVLRAVCARAQFPEWMLTADPSSGTFTNSFIAEAPSTKAFGTAQKTLAGYVWTNRRRRHRSMAWAQVVHAVKCGLLPEDVLHTVQIEAKGPGLVVRDKEGEARTNKLLMEMRIKPPQMVQQEAGIDPETAKKMWSEWDKQEEERQTHQAKLQQSLQPPAPPGGNGGADDDADGGDEPNEPNDNPPKKPAGLQEAVDGSAVAPFDTEHLASLYAELWDERHPLDVGDEELATAFAELADGSHVPDYSEAIGAWVVAPVTECALLEAFDESKVKRDHGKFSSKPGGKSDKKPAHGKKAKEKVPVARHAPPLPVAQHAPPIPVARHAPPLSSERAQELHRQIEKEPEEKRPGLLKRLWGAITRREPDRTNSGGIQVRDAKTKAFTMHVNEAKKEAEANGVKDLWKTNLYDSPVLRHLGVSDPATFNKSMDRLELSLHQAAKFGEGNTAAQNAIKTKLEQAGKLKAAVAKYHAELTPDVLPNTYGKRGQGKANVDQAALHIRHGGDAKSAVRHLMKEKKLSESTARLYVRKAVKALAKEADENILKLQTNHDAEVQRAERAGVSRERIEAAVQSGRRSGGGGRSA